MGEPIGIEIRVAKVNYEKGCVCFKRLNGD